MNAQIDIASISSVVPSSESRAPEGEKYRTDKEIQNVPHHRISTQRKCCFVCLKIVCAQFLIPMSVSKKIPSEEHRLGAQFMELCETLGSPSYRKHLEKRLAFWVNPSDKRLPIALLGRKVGEILDMSLESILNLPSIGEKKFNALISLLIRVANTPEEDLPPLDPREQVSSGEKTRNEPTEDLSVSWVSEFDWNHWQRVVLEQGLEHEKIGRLCRSLEEMPRVLWNKPLSTYCRVSLGELRSMKTHGERRVYAILNLFRDIFEVASKFKDVPRLRVRMSLRWTDDMQQWMQEKIEVGPFPLKKEVFERFIGPCLSQLQVDSTESVVQLAESRLGFHGPITSVRQSAREMNIARARVYQLLSLISDIMYVRWPEGNLLVQQLRDKCIREMINSSDPSQFEQFMAAAELFYPSTKSGLEKSYEEFELSIPIPTVHEMSYPSLPR